MIDLTQRRSPWRRTPFQRRIVDFRRLLIRKRLIVRVAAFALAFGLVGASVAVGVPRWIGRSFDLAKSSLGTKIGLEVSVVSVEGCEHLSQQDVADALAIPVGASLLDVDVAAARQRVLSLGWVKEATILRVPPDRLHVAIAEYEPKILWRRGARAFVADESGHVIASVDPASYGELFRVDGEGAVETAPTLMQWLRAMPQIGARVEFAERIGERRWNLHLGNELVVELPDRGLDEALAVLTRMITDNGLLEREAGVLDLRNPKVPRLRFNEDAAPTPLVPRDDF